jgi:hypothetical protein
VSITWPSRRPALRRVVFVGQLRLRFDHEARVPLFPKRRLRLVEPIGKPTVGPVVGAR